MVIYEKLCGVVGFMLKVALGSSMLICMAIGLATIMGGFECTL